MHTFVICHSPTANQPPILSVSPLFISRPLPSLETPQQEFHTPTEESKATEKSKATQERQSPEQAVEEALESQQSVVTGSVDRAESPRTTAEPPEKAQEIVDDQKPPQSPIAGPQKNINRLELAESTKTEEQPPQELAQAEEGKVGSFGTVEKLLWLQEPTSSIDQLPEQPKHEELNTSEATTELHKAEKNLITETPVEIPPEEELKDETTVTATIPELALEEHEIG